jgi:hypothetical protein
VPAALRLRRFCFGLCVRRVGDLLQLRLQIPPANVIFSRKCPLRKGIQSETLL